MRPYRAIPIGGKDFVYGWLFERAGGSYIIPFTDNYHTPASFVLTFVQVIPVSVGQSIIVEGKEFYEGDVTKDDSGNIGVVRFGKLPLDKSGDCVCVYPAFYIKCFGQLGQAPTYACQEIGEWMEIIGTIYTTHPELKEQDNDR